MIKTALIIIFAILILALIGSNFEQQNLITILIGNYEIETSQSFLLFLIIVTVIISFLVIYMLVSFFFISRYRNIISKNKNYRTSLNDMVDCITLTSLGDYKGSQKYLRKIDKSLNNHPIASLLNLQSHALKNNKKEMHKHFEKLLKHQNTKHFALQGLALIAKKNNQLDKAEKYLEESYQEIPEATNTVIALIELYKQTGNWHKLLQIATDAIKRKVILRTDFGAEIAIAHLMLANELDPSKEQEKHIISAQKIAPENPEIQISYAKYLLSKKKKSTLTKYIKAVWKNCQIPELIDIYLENIKTKKLKQKFKALEQLIDINPRGEAVILKYANLSYNHNSNYVKTKNLIKLYLSNTNSENIYDMAVKFFSEFQENIEDEEFYDDLLRQNKNYNNKIGYTCNSCKAEYEKWQTSCKECQSFNSIDYDFTKPIALIKLSDD